MLSSHNCCIASGAKLSFAFLLIQLSWNELVILGVVFLFSQFSPMEIIVFDKTFLYPIEDIDFLSSSLKSYFTSDFFVKFWWFENCQIGHVLA